MELAIKQQQQQLTSSMTLYQQHLSAITLEITGLKDMALSLEQVVGPLPFAPDFHSCTLNRVHPAQGWRGVPTFTMGEPRVQEWLAWCMVWCSP